MKTKYKLGITHETYMTFQEATGYDQNENLKVYFNTNHTGLAEFSNFIKAEERAFIKEEELFELSKELEMPYWVVISFYRENGWSGMYINTGEESLRVKCNNWVNNGRDGFLFIAFSKTNEELNCFLETMEKYIEEGFYEIYVKEIAIHEDDEDDEDDYEIIDGIIITREKDIEYARKSFKKNYGFTDDDFDELDY